MLSKEHLTAVLKAAATHTSKVRREAHRAYHLAVRERMPFNQVDAAWRVFEEAQIAADRASRIYRHSMALSADVGTTDFDSIWQGLAEADGGDSHLRNPDRRSATQPETRFERRGAHRLDQ